MYFPHVCIENVIEKLYGQKRNIIRYSWSQSDLKNIHARIVLSQCSKMLYVSAFISVLPTVYKKQHKSPQFIIKSHNNVGEEIKKLGHVIN